MDVVNGEGVTKLGNGVPQLRFGSRGPGSYIPSKRLKEHFNRSEVRRVGWKVEKFYPA